MKNKQIDNSLWKIETRKVSELIKNPRNPRVITKETLKGVRESLLKNGYIDKIVVNNKNLILSGHARQIIFKEQTPDAEIEVLVAQRDLTPDEEDNVLLGMNTQGGKWDLKDLGLNFDPLKLDTFGIDFDKPKSQIEIIEDEAPEVDESVPPVSKLGDVWLCGKHRVMCGDSTIIDDVNKLTNDTLVDMLLTDPPYNVNYEGGTKDKLKINNDSMSNDKFRQFLKDAFSCANSVMKSGAVFYIWHSDSEGYNFRGACNQAKSEVYYVKNK